MMINLDDLPAELLPFKDNILATVKPVIEITLSPAQNLELWTSKVGGKPYLPSPVMYPQDGDGNPLLFLAQINCEELPQNDLLPTEGILCFFIGGDDLYGLDFDNRLKQDGFSVFYFNKILKDENLLWTDFSTIQEIRQDEDLYSPVEKGNSYQMQFELTEKEISYEDFNFQRDFFDDTNFRKAFMTFKQNELGKNSEIFQSFSHHLLGYPYFVQNDPRDVENYANYILLFQLMTEYNDKVKIYFGDSGVMNFFIDPIDLANKDFSRVLYNWDC